MSMVCGRGLAHSSESAGADSVALPGEGDTRPAIQYDYFPSRMHAFVFRNWSLVPASRLARVLHTNTAHLTRIARSMGLPAQKKLEKEWLTSRGYITVLRRNWHLLPYDQLLELLGMSRSELAQRLIDDDFLWVKLGNLKPYCQPLRYEEPTAEANQRAAQIAAWLGELGTQPFARETPRFDFVRTFTHPDRKLTTTSAASDSSGFDERVIFSYMTDYGDPLLDPKLGSCPEGLLQQLAANGVNGIWLHTVLRTLVPPDGPFPGDRQASQRIKGLQRLVARAARYGIKIYLYLNEPRGMQRSFFESSAQHRALGGVTEGNMQAFCIFNPDVSRWLSRSLETLFGSVQGLGGVFTITASENLTTCASHGAWSNCPRCREHSFADGIVEVNRAITEGVHRGDPNARVWVWDWGWIDSEAEEIINRLPKSCSLMSVSEWSMPIRRGGIPSTVGEYSLSSVGPGPRALSHWQMARRAGLRTIAKVQVNASWEMASVPAVPVLELVGAHAENLSHEQIDGVMLSWSVGGYPSANLSLFQSYRQGNLSAQLDSVATHYYGPRAVNSVRAAWHACSEHFKEFPYHIQTLYHGPQHMGVANSIYTHPTGYGATMVGLPYDDYRTWLSIYPIEVWTRQMKLAAKGFGQAAQWFGQAAANATGLYAERLRTEQRRCQVIRQQLLSAADQARYTAARDRWATTADPQATAVMRKALLRELRRVVVMLPLVKADATIGYESSNHYFFVPYDLLEKYISVRYALQQLPSATAPHAQL